MYEQKINIDLLSDFLVSTGELETNGDATRVNNKAGATGVGVGLQIGSKVNDFQWSILGRFSRTFEGETNYAGFKVIYGAHSAGNVEGSTLFLLTNKTYFKTTLAVAIADRYQIAKSVTSASSTTETLGGELQQLWSPNLLFRGGMSVGNTTTNGVQQFTTWIFNLGLKYQY